MGNCKCNFYTLQGVCMKINLVKEICLSCWLTMPELSDITGIKQQRLKDISSGRVEGFKSEDVSLMVDKLHLSAEWLTTFEGEVFKNGFSRSYPTKALFVSGVIDRMVKIVEPNFISAVADDVLDIPDGTVIKWMQAEKIPYWYIKKFGEKYGKSYDFLLYGINQKSLNYGLAPYVDRKTAQDTLADNIYLTSREKALLDDFRSMTDEEKNAAEAMLHVVAKSKLKKA